MNGNIACNNKNRLISKKSEAMICLESLLP